jgi:hypothetical protein
MSVARITNLFASLRVRLFGRRRRAVASPVLKQMRRMEARQRRRA